MPRTSRLVAVAAAIFIVGLLVLFPARVAYHWFVPEDLRMTGLSGTIWRGAAVECRAADLWLGNVTWRFRPLALLTGKAGFAMAAEPAGGFIAGDVAISPGGAVHLADLSARLPITAVGGVGTLAGIDGMLDLRFESLVLRDGVPVSGAGTIEVANLVAPQLSPAPLGNYQAQFETVEGLVSGRIEDLSGMLDLAGTIELRPDRSYSLAGRVAANAGAPAGVVQQLSYLGSPDADGMRDFRFEGSLQD